MVRRIVALTLSVMMTRGVIGRAAAGTITAGDAADTIAPGTVITTSNLQQYTRFMPDGMAALLGGKFFWQSPADLRMEVEATTVDPLPPNYLATTEKYAAQNQIVELPGGSLNLANYHGGVPFPNPQEPHKGGKLLLNLWYRYAPHLIADSEGIGCAINSFGSQNCQKFQIVVRQLSYVTDTGVPNGLPDADAKYITQWFMVTEPEQQRYTASLDIDYVDLTKPEDAYVFLPALRRYQRLSVSARCSAFDGTDWTSEEFRSGLDSNLTELQAEYLGHRKILAMVDPRPLIKPFPFGFALPMAWPTPDLGRWQLRDVDVISVKKTPSRAAGYCYGNRVIFMDSHFFSPLWEELYDAQMKLWKFDMVMPQRTNVPGIGVANLPGADVEQLWDIKRNHATVGAEGRPELYVNEEAPAEFQDISRYTTPAGLNLIMR